ncbi:Zinc finger, CCHC-type [Purpureocillium lavendulum]|uniref:Zinc finger, CCHC-type n=1 Tax=Purpureocillium lavendulum TaxID=1247861 RepID=A0AB34FEA1_9HYPO|nr:Zinc finger, CCHC-type [Purpureocillium lavendulum]
MKTADADISAAERALGTTELLEQILLHLDMQTLLVSATRACRQWNSLIAASPLLQKALFLRPDDDGDATPADAVVNPLLAQHFPPFFTPVYDIGCPFPIQSLEPDEDCYEYLFKDISYNGMSKFKSMPVYKRSVANDDFIDEYEEDPNAKARENNPYLRKCASWRKMLTSQPPAQNLGFCMLSTGGLNTITRTELLHIEGVKDGGAEDRDEDTPTVNEDRPIRMADLYAKVLLYMKIGSKNSGFKMMSNLRNHTRDYVTQYASLPFHPHFAWIGDRIGKLYDEGADIVLLQVVRPMGCFLMGPDAGANAVWRRCQPENLSSQLMYSMKTGDAA